MQENGEQEAHVRERKKDNNNDEESIENRETNLEKGLREKTIVI